MKDIMAIPVRSGHEDFVAWHYDAKGVLSVKSAYHVLDDKKEFSAVRQRGESSGSREVTSGQFKWKKSGSYQFNQKLGNLFGDYCIIVCR